MLIEKKLITMCFTGVQATSSQTVNIMLAKAAAGECSPADTIDGANTAVVKVNLDESANNDDRS